MTNDERMSNDECRKSRDNPFVIRHSFVIGHWSFVIRLGGPFPVFEIIYRFDSAAQSSRQAPADSAEAWRRLEEGNSSFASLLTDAHDDARIFYCNPEDVGVTTTGDAPRQRPFAVVLGCSDARVPTEM